MKKSLKMLSAVCFVVALLVTGGCGSGSDSTTVTTTPTPTPTPVASIVALDDLGTPDVAASRSASLGAFDFTDSASAANNVVIAGFDADDAITITGATSVQYDTAISSTGTGNVIISYNNGTALSQIVLLDVIPTGFVYDVATFNALPVGNISFQ